MSSNSNDKPKNKIVGLEDGSSITIDSLAVVLVKNNLTEIEYEEDGRRIYISKKATTFVSESFNQQVEQQNVQQSQISSKPFSEESKKEPEEIDWKKHPGSIKSPMVGVVYTAPEPGSEPFVRIGDVVHPGQTLLIVEAMKVLNPIKATKTGKVMMILVHDQKPVEYDEPLVVIE